MAAGKIFVLGNEGTENEFAQALDAKDGKQIWSVHIGEVGNPKQQPSYPGARSTPTVDGARVYVLGSDGDLACLETATGKAVWQKSFRKDFGGEPGRWAYAESPLVDGDTLVCTPGGSSATLVALNKKTGEVIWKCALPGEAASYASASVVTIGGVKQYVQFVQKGVVGVDAKSGKLLWRYDKTATGSMANIPTPVINNGYLYSSTGQGFGGLIHLVAKQGEVEVEPGYLSKKLPNGIGGAVKVGDYLYGTTPQALQCVDFLKGDVKWEERGIGAASVCYADGLLYEHGEDGEVALVEATPSAYHEIGRFTPSGGPDRGSAKAWTYPVIANGRLYIRDVGALWCYDIKGAEK